MASLSPPLSALFPSFPPCCVSIWTRAGWLLHPYIHTSIHPSHHLISHLLTSSSLDPRVACTFVRAPGGLSLSPSPHLIDTGHWLDTEKKADRLIMRLRALRSLPHYSCCVIVIYINALFELQLLKKGLFLINNYKQPGGDQQPCRQRGCSLLDPMEKETHTQCEHMHVLSVRSKV